jgi:hypothetical protein
VTDTQPAGGGLIIATGLTGGAVIAISGADVQQGAHPVTVMGNLADSFGAKDAGGNIKLPGTFAPQTGAADVVQWYRAIMGNAAQTIWGDASTGATAFGVGYNVLS